MRELRLHIRCDRCNREYETAEDALGVGILTGRERVSLIDLCEECSVSATLGECAEILTRIPARSLAVKGKIAAAGNPNRTRPPSPRRRSLFPDGQDYRCPVCGNHYDRIQALTMHLSRAHEKRLRDFPQAFMDYASDREWAARQLAQGQAR